MRATVFCNCGSEQDIGKQTGEEYQKGENVRDADCLTRIRGNK
jgi:hypothetical protein